MVFETNNLSAYPCLGKQAYHYRQLKTEKLFLLLLEVIIKISVTVVTYLTQNCLTKLLKLALVLLIMCQNELDEILLRVCCNNNEVNYCQTNA